ncbi:Fe(3+)-hydroxamate ABC transporter permease FhuB [Phyllobacterium ifriqiyense]|uniref:Fe(3+)-hydroxamate ABC transporter permease FhuB n=1 Tax=Phyllobacterium ifriqiyense TaxID=314238 RepID=UPI00339A540B
MIEPKALNRGLLLWGVLLIVAASLFAGQIAAQFSLATRVAPEFAGLQKLILMDSILPRSAMAILCGAALGFSGALLQRVLRNPLAEPSTLGISAGAQLAMAIAMLYFPALMEGGREAVALAGGLIAVALILSLTWQRGLEPVSVVLAGMMVSLTATAASAALILANGEYMFSLFIWGGGSLAQQSWVPVSGIIWKILLACAASIVLLRPLSILGLDDASAKNLGVALQGTRFLVIGLAVWLATSVTAEVGIIGFVGLAAPALARLTGARSPRQMLAAAPLVGAILLWLADGFVQLAAGSGGERIPTGAATALLGGPLLLWLLPRLRMFEWPSLNAKPAPSPRARRPAWTVAVLVILTGLAAGIALVLGRGPEGWVIARGELLADLLPWRWPRTVIAAASGAMLAAAGQVMQRVTANPLASPEILGVGTGAGVGIAVPLMLLSAPNQIVLLAGAMAGSIIVLAFMLAMSARSGFGPERLLLSGIAMGALCSAILTAIIATGSPQAFMLLGWVSGSSAERLPEEVWVALVALVLLVLPLVFTTRWLDMLPLGRPVGLETGLPIRMSRGILIILSACLTAVASLFVGPLSFVGLIAPHLARLIGLHRPLTGLIGAMLIGACLMVLSDWLARMVAFPYQLPLGLFASLISGPYLIWLLSKGGRN